MGRCPPDNWPVPAAAFEVLRSQSRDLAQGCQQGRWSWAHPFLCPFWDILTPGTELNVDVSLLPLGQCPSLGAGGPGASPHPMGLSGSSPFSLPLAGTGGQGAHTALARVPPGAAPARISGGGRGGGITSASSQPCPIPAAPPAGQGAAGRFGSQPQLPRTGASQCLALLPPEGTHQQPGAPHHPWHQRGTSRVRGGCVGSPRERAKPREGAGVLFGSRSAAGCCWCTRDPSLSSAPCLGAPWVCLAANGTCVDVG